MEVKSYKVNLYGGRVLNYGNLGQKISTTAQVLLQGDAPDAWFVFYDPDKTDEVPKDRFSNDPGGTYVFIPKDQYFMHLDLLRNEKPLFFVEDGTVWWRGSLRTGQEEVGEGE